MVLEFANVQTYFFFGGVVEGTNLNNIWITVSCKDASVSCHLAA